MVTFGNNLNESLLDVLTLKHKVIADNIANVDTPYYKAKEVVFQDELRRQLENGDQAKLQLHQTEAKHLPGHKPPTEVPHQVRKLSHTVMNNNQNNVDIDYEMASLAKNQLVYNYMIDRVGGYYSKHKKLLADLR
ncbi:flagellar basal body rod protein FlgB [Paenibacillus sp. YYML68]|uniref:flagellar basal body rod protein FlgB n=1 Tax=Paenibacillus sp. YYML68 TaxID=2909250 RepID=UPI002493A335|nr:flagellar basal body rod protein FlgB [Paenibacillus sp. YYML68]